GQTETRFCLEEGPSYVAIAGPNSDTASIGSVGAQLTDEKIANDFALDWVRLPITSSISLTVDAQDGGGVLRTSVACRAGQQVTVLSGPSVARGSTDAVHTNVDTSVCNAAVLVITNEHQTSATPSSRSNATYDVASS
ncbi:MAG TPA: hypothetical protein VI341_05270, partial [Actinomycetota bacterium]